MYDTEALRMRGGGGGEVVGEVVGEVGSVVAACLGCSEQWYNVNLMTILGIAC